MTVVLKDLRHWQIKVLGCWSLCYFIGKLCGQLSIGPQFIQWHLDDFGLIPLLTFGSLLGSWLITGNLSKRKVEYAEWVALLGLSFSVTVEALMLWFQFENPEHAKIGGDWIDITIYVVSYLTVCHLLSTLHDRLHGETNKTL